MKYDSFSSLAHSTIQQTFIVPPQLKILAHNHYHLQYFELVFMQQQIHEFYSVDNKVDNSIPCLRH